MATPTSTTINVVDPAQITGSTGTYYTAGAGGASKIVELSVANDTTTAITFSLYYVPSGGTAGDGNIIVKNQTLASGDAFSVTELLGPIYLEASGTIQAIASAASQATLRISALEFA